MEKLNIEKNELETYTKEDVSKLRFIKAFAFISLMLLIAGAVLAGLFNDKITYPTESLVIL